VIAYQNLLHPSLKDNGSGEDGLVREFLRLARVHSAYLEQLNFPQRLVSGRSEEQFRQLPVMRKWQVLADLTVNSEIITEMVEEDPSSSSGRDFEFKCFDKALRKFKLKLKDNDIFSKIDADDIIEIYTHEGIQIYRSWSCFKFCRYSVEDLLVNNWQTLYSRPTYVVNYLMNLAPQIFQPDCETVPYDLHEYLIVEKFISEKRALLFQMKYASPLQNIETGQTVAFVSTGAMRFAPESVIGANVDLI